MVAGKKVEIGCVLAAAGAPGATDHELYRGMLDDCELFAQLGFGTMWVLEHHFSDYFPAPDPAVQISHLAGRFPGLGFGTCVLVTPWHNPLRLAGQITMGKLTVAALGDVAGLLPYEEMTAKLGR